MAHFNLIKTDDIHNGPVDYSSPVGNSAIFVCSKTVKNALETSRPAARSFTANAKHNSHWLEKFSIHTDGYPDFVKYARGKSGVWYAQAVYL